MTPSWASLPSPALHGWSFDRFDKMTDLVEEPSDLTSPGIGSPEARRKASHPASLAVQSGQTKYR
jgi:hypothetical protein